MLSTWNSSLPLYGSPGWIGAPLAVKAKPPAERSSRRASTRFAVGADVADARRQLDPGELALGFGFVHDVDVDGCIHGVGSCSVQSGSICARAAAWRCP